MSFLSPWFLAGIVLVAGPIIAHLIRRATRQRVSFSAMRFLKASPPKLDRRNHIEHPWLLLLRCLVIAVLAAGFARPFLKKDLPAINQPTVPQSVVAVLDESASMNRAGLWDAARKKISDLADSLGPKDQLMVLGASDGVTEIVSREHWQATPPSERTTMVRAALADRQPGWGPKNLDSAIENAVGDWEGMTEAANVTTRKRIVVVSDFTASTRITGLAGLAWPKDSQVELETVSPTYPGDAGVQWLSWAPAADGSLALRVSVVQSKKSTVSNLRVVLRDAKTNAALGEPVLVTPQADNSQVVVLPVPAGEAKNPLRVDLEGDPEKFDNTVWAAHPTPRQMNLAYYGAANVDDIHHAGYYLQRAVSGLKDPAITFLTNPTASGNFSPGGEIAVVTEPLDATAADALRKRVEAGEFAVVLLSKPEMVDTASALIGEPGWKPVTPKRGDALFGQIDFQHPLFSLFADPRYSDFTHIRFWHPQSVLLPDKSTATVVAQFDDGSPAVLEAPVGKGRVIVWGSDWEPSSSQWVLSTKFVPWLQALFERAGGGAAHPVIAEIGDTARLAGSEPAKWRSLAAAEGTFQETPPREPGVYQLEQNGSTRWVALEVPAAASNIAPLPLEDWEKMGVPLHAKPVTAASPITAPLGQEQTGPVLEARQKLWRWLLLSAAVLLALESIYSLALSRRSSYNNQNEVAT